MEKVGYYAVEDILSKKNLGKKTLYLVKWEGYGPEDNTWEPLENVKKTVAFAEFLKKNPEESSSSAKSSPTVKKRRSTSSRSSPVKRTRRSALDKSAETDADSEPAPAAKIKDDPADEEEPATELPANSVASSEPETVEMATAEPQETADNPAPPPVDAQDGEEPVTTLAAQEEPSSEAETPAVESDAPMSDINSQVDLAQVDKKQPDKNLIPDCIWSIFNHKTSGKPYCLIKWKNAADRVQILSVDYVREHYPAMLIDFLLAERTSAK